MPSLYEIGSAFDAFLSVGLMMCALNVYAATAVEVDTGGRNV